LKKVIFILTICLLALTSIKAQTINGFKLTWSDEFNGAAGAPDAKKWDRPEYLRKPNPSGPDGYWSREDSFIDGKGNLVVTVRKIANKNGDADAFDYSSGALRTKGKFQQLYGHYEIRCQLPKQQGWWVAFWMMQGNVGSELNKYIDGAEVDIMEAFGWTNKINHAIHYDGYGAAHKSDGVNELIAGIRTGYHIYSMDWFPDKYLFYVDGKQVWDSSKSLTIKGVCNQPGYVKVTAEISTESWAINQWWAMDPAKATYPDSFKVDYVRVYQFDNSTSTNSIEEDKSIKVYPNPVDDFMSINLPENLSGNEKVDIQITNSTGQIVKSFKQIYNPMELQVSDLKHGLCFVTIQSKENSYTQKFMKN
jgi:beta-glucanase (GH16 family)